MTMTQLLTKEQAMNWKHFVAEYVVLMTKTKERRSLIDGYQVKKAGSKYHIFFGLTTSYQPMDAETLYGWAQRLPLKYYADKADELRYELCK